MSYLPLDQSHPDAVFSLVPANDRAAAAVTLPANSPRRTTLPNDDAALTVDLIRNVQHDRTLATLGLAGADIVLPGTDSAVQCSFELHPDLNGYIMLHDRSRSNTTQVSGNGVYAYQPGQPRQIVIQQGVGMVLRMGRGCNLFVFKIDMHVDAEDIHEIFQSIGIRSSATASFHGAPHVPFLDRLSSARGTHPQIRYSTIEAVGDGGFGQVLKCVNVDTGSIMAVKTTLARDLHHSFLHVMHREIETLGAVSHENIVEFLGSQEDETGNMEIFMALKDGCVTDLVEDRPKPRFLARDILVQMLRALVYLDSSELIHRDVKPENILYSCRKDGKHQFFLADFGVSNWVEDSSTCCGTPLFRAPEIWKHEEQSPKVDVWALFVTFLWVANIRGFRTGTPMGFGPYIWAKVQSVGYLKGISKIVSMLRDMGAEDPELRPSASEALDLLEESE